MRLNPDEWRALSRLLDEALELPETAWAAWCDRQQGVSAALRAALKAHLADESVGGNRLPDLPEFSAAELGLVAIEAGFAAGAEIGPYRLIREIGCGGMGSVWLAESADGGLKRRLALKLPHTGLARAKLVERFARERDILASLEHAHIARLYDAGVSTQGQPWLAMEYVEGRPLTEHCREQAVRLIERLKLFLQVVDAVQYAHGRLVIHRDLKPSNILVNAAGEARLLDFGIARLLDDGGGLTEFDARPLTPQYAAPEQILGEPVGITADVYGLGVLLYELLADAAPYQLPRNTRGALERAILEVDPLPPSRAAEGKMAWARALRGDLDVIVQKAMKKAPGERYATAAALADDLRRYLAGELVAARPDSSWYRARKFFRRHRLPVAAGAFAVVALVVGLGVALWQADVARKEAATAKAINEFMQDIFVANSAQQGDPETARRTTARELLDIAAGKIDESLKDAPGARIALLKMFAEIYGQLGLLEVAQSFTERVTAETRQVHGAQSIELVDALLVDAVAQRLADIDSPHQAESLAEAEAILESMRNPSEESQMVYWTLAAEYYADHDFAKATLLARRAAAEVPAQLEIEGIGAEPNVYIKLARLAVVAGDCAGALDKATRAANLSRQGIAPAAVGNVGYMSLAPALEIAGQAKWCLADRDAAVRSLRDALDASRKTFGDADLETLRIEARLADLLFAAGRHDEGRLLLDHALSALANYPADNASRLHFEALAAAARAQLDDQQFHSALALADRALALRHQGIDASPFVALVLREKAGALAGLLRYREASEVLVKAKAMREKSGTSAPAALREEAETAHLLDR